MPPFGRKDGYYPLEVMATGEVGVSRKDFPLPMVLTLQRPVVE
jgi:hypothetical protein